MPLATVHGFPEAPIPSNRLAATASSACCFGNRWRSGDADRANLDVVDKRNPQLD